MNKHYLRTWKKLFLIVAKTIFARGENYFWSWRKLFLQRPAPEHILSHILKSSNKIDASSIQVIQKSLHSDMANKTIKMKAFFSYLTQYHRGLEHEIGEKDNNQKYYLHSLSMIVSRRGEWRFSAFIAFISKKTFIFAEKRKT